MGTRVRRHAEAGTDKHSVRKRIRRLTVSASQDAYSFVATLNVSSVSVMRSASSINGATVTIRVSYGTRC